MTDEVLRSHSAVSYNRFNQKVPYPDQRLPQHESLYPIGLKSAWIEIPHIGSQYIDFSKTNTKTALQWVHSNLFY